MAEVLALQQRYGKALLRLVAALGDWRDKRPSSLAELATMRELVFELCQ